MHTAPPNFELPWYSGRAPLATSRKSISHSGTKSLTKKDQISAFLRRKMINKREKSITKKDQNVAFCIFTLKCKFLQFSRKSLTKKKIKITFLTNKKKSKSRILPNTKSKFDDTKIADSVHKICWRCIPRFLTVYTKFVDSFWFLKLYFFLQLMMVCIKCYD